MKDGNPNLHKEFSVYLGIPFSVFGLVGNCISIFVWNNIIKKREGSRKSVGVYLIVLAFVDSLLLICFLTYESLPELFPVIKENKNFVTFACYVGFPLYFFFVVASIWMVIGVTVNRFVAVIFPLKAEIYNSIKMTIIFISSTMLFSFIINIPHFFNLHPAVVNGTTIISTTAYGLTNGAELYDLWVHCMFLVLVPWIIITVLNSLIIHKLLFKTRIQKHKKSERKQSERQTSITLLVVSISFLVFLIWQCIAQCFWMFHYGINDPKIWFDVSTSYAPARLGVVINASMNFSFYCLSGSFFREEMRKMFGCGGKRGYSLLTSTNTTFTSQSKTISTGYDEILIDADKAERGKIIADDNDPIM